MKVVLTGGLGFIGQNLAHHLKSKPEEYHLTAVDQFTDAADDEKAPFDHILHADFAAGEALELYEGADVVVHLAARTTVQESIDDPLATFEQNVVRTQTVLDHLRTRAPGAKFVFASTGGAIIGEWPDAIHEEVNPKPLSPYGASKLAVEGLLSAYRGSFGLSSASMRFANVYGPNSRRKGSVIAAFCKRYLNDGTVQINGDGKQTRDYIYVADIAEAIARVIEKDAQGVFQLGTGRGTSINEVVEMFNAVAADAPPKVVAAPALKGEVRHNRADISRARDVLGFEPAWSLEDGIRSTLHWFKTQA
ncbi:MAG: NAD-dependent epimerase/dehydratase family protein [Pseudomonadota bacterium]